MHILYNTLTHTYALAETHVVHGQGVFRVAAIGESQAISGAFNIITVTLRPNIDIPANSNITIVGLVRLHALCLHRLAHNFSYMQHDMWSYFYMRQ